MTQPKKHSGTNNKDLPSLYARVRAIESALLEGTIQGLILTCYENERPLRGLASAVDLRLGGGISNALRKGALTGKKGELVYVPIPQKDKQGLHFILIGCGLLSTLDPEKRPELSSDFFDTTLPLLDKLLGGKNSPRLGISAWDLGYPSSEDLSQSFKKTFKNRDYPLYD